MLRAGWSVLPEGLSPFSDVPELPKPPDVRAGFLRNDSDCDPGTDCLLARLAWQEGVILPSDPSPSGVNKPGVPGRPFKARGQPRAPTVYEGWPRWPGRVPPPCTASVLSRTNRRGWPRAVHAA